MVFPVVDIFDYQNAELTAEDVATSAAANDEVIVSYTDRANNTAGDAVFEQVAAGSAVIADFHVNWY